jgi:hypothetical protein
LPAHHHDLVEAHAGERPADDHGEADQQHDFAEIDGELGEDRQEGRGLGAQQVDAGQVVAAEEEQGEEGRAGDEVGILGHKEEGEAHR